MGLGRVRGRVMVRVRLRVRDRGGVSIRVSFHSNIVIFILFLRLVP